MGLLVYYEWQPMMSEDGVLVDEQLIIDTLFDESSSYVSPNTYIHLNDHDGWWVVKPEPNQTYIHQKYLITLPIQCHSIIQPKKYTNIYTNIVTK